MDRISNERLAEMLAGLEGVTPGPWYQTGAPWFSGSDGVLAGSPDGNIAYLIADCDDGMNPRDEYVEGQGPFPLGDKDADAAHIARCDPDTMRSILTELQSLRSQPAGVRVQGLDHARKLREVAAQLSVERVQGWANPLVSVLTGAANFLDPQPLPSGDVVLSALEPQEDGAVAVCAAKGLPPAFGGCTCSCHRVPGIMHMAACCHPGKEQVDLSISKEWYERHAGLEDGVDVSIGTHPAPTEPSREGEAVKLLRSYLEDFEQRMAIGQKTDVAEAELIKRTRAFLAALATPSKPVSATDDMVDALLRGWYGETYNPGALGPEVREYHRQKAYSALRAALEVSP